MLKHLSKLIDDLSNFFAPRKGLLPIIGILFILTNFILSFFNLGWLSSSNLFLHLGIIIITLGMMLAWSL